MTHIVHETAETYTPTERHLLLARILMSPDENQNVKETRKNIVQMIHILQGPRIGNLKPEDRTNICWIPTRKSLIMPWPRKTEEAFREDSKAKKRIIEDEANRLGFSKFKINDPYFCVVSDGINYEAFDIVNIDPVVTLIRASEFLTFDSPKEIIDFFRNRLIKSRSDDYVM